MLTFQNFEDLSILFCKEIHKKILILMSFHVLKTIFFPNRMIFRSLNIVKKLYLKKRKYIEISSISFHSQNDILPEKKIFLRNPLCSTYSRFS